MKKIESYQCDFCKLIRKTKAAMAKHEPRCFKNPASKSCITCKHFGLVNTFSDRVLTQHEEDVLCGKVESAITIKTTPEDGQYWELNEPFKYLEAVESRHRCEIHDVLINKLKTNCPVYRPVPGPPLINTEPVSNQQVQI